MLQFIQAFGSYTFYEIVHYLSEKYFISRLDKHVVAKLDICDRIDLPEKIPSTINGLVVGTLGLYVIFWEKAFENDVVYPYPLALDLLFGSFVGYTAYDLKIMWSKPQEELSMWVHHILGLIGSTLILFKRQAAFFPALFSITEITVIPGNLVWFLQRLELKKTKLYTIGLALRAGFFLTFRTFVAPFCYYYAVSNPGPLLPHMNTILKKYSLIATSRNTGQLLSKLTWEDKAQVLKANLFQLEAIVPILCIFFVTIFGILNVGWTYVIVGNFFRKWFKSKPKPKGK